MSLAESVWLADTDVPLIEQTVGGLLAQRAAERAQALALVGTTHDIERNGAGDGFAQLRRLSYGELHDEASRVAAALLELAEPGAMVALWAPNIVEWPIVQYGAALAGMTLVALNPALPAADLRYALTHSQAAVLLHADTYRDRDLAAVVAEVRPACPDLRSVMSLRETPRWRATRAPASLPEVGPDDPAMLHYTSGTTGMPKGVLLRHRSLVNVSRLTLEAVEAEPRATCVNPLPMFHTAGCVIANLGPLWLGGTLIVVERFEPASTLRLIRAEGARVLFFVPTVLGALLESARAGEEPPPRIDTVMGGASNVPPTMIDGAAELFGASVHDLFGQTELAPVLSANRRGDTHEDRLRTVGAPLPRVDCKVVDPDTGGVQPLGVSGEICARGYQQMIGYLHDPQATAATVDADGWVHTGDLGAMDARGMLTLTGRLKELIIRGGENIAPAEVESCLAEHEGVAEAAVLGLPDERLGEVVAAVIRPAGDSAGLRVALEEHCARRLVRFKVPQRWFVVNELPATPTGKIQKFRLREQIGRLPRL